MMRISFLLVCICLIHGLANAQILTNRTCNDRLREAQRSYQAGQLSKVETQIADCLNDRIFKSRVKLEEGFQLLTESYLFQDKLREASLSFENLLTVNPLYEADSTVPSNSYDLIYLSRTYRRKPIVSIYGNIGANYSLIDILQDYSTDNIGRAAEDYRKFSLGSSIALGVELPVWRDLTFAIEANLANRSYRYTDTLYLSSDANNPRQKELQYGILKFIESQLWLDVPVVFRYEYYLKDERLKWFIPYAYVGAAPNFLISSELKNIQRNTTREQSGGGGVVGGEVTVDIAGRSLKKSGNLSLRNTFNLSLVGGLGAKIRAGRNFVVVEARYNRMILNMVNRKNRYSNNQLLFEYAYVDNDLRMDNFALTVGFQKAFYKPRKKREYNPIHVNKKLEKIIRREKSNVKRTTDAELKRELNSFLRDLERDKPGILEDVRRGRASSTIIKKTTDKLDKIKRN